MAENLFDLTSLSIPIKGTPDVAFLNAIRTVRNIVTQIEGNFVDKAIFIHSSGFQDLLKELFKFNFKTKTQLQILKFMDYVITSITSQFEFQLFFGDNILNTVITYNYNSGNNDIVTMYTALLKSIALKLSIIPDMSLFSYGMIDLPIYTRTFPYLNNKDSIIVSASRFVFLTFVNSKSELILQFTQSVIPYKQISTLFQSMDSEEFDFVRDIMMSNNSKLINFVGNVFLSTLNHKKDLKFLIKVMQTKLDTHLIFHLNYSILSFDFSQTLNCGILLSAIESGYILHETGTKLGFFSDDNELPINSMFLEVLKFKNPTLLNICLKIYEKVYVSPPKQLFKFQSTIVQIIRNNFSRDYTFAFVGRTDAPMRYDLNYLMSKEFFNEPDTPENQVKMLWLIQQSIARWFGTKTPGFAYPEILGKSIIKLKTFDESLVEVSPSTVTVGRMVFSLMNLQLTRISKKSISLRESGRRKVSALELSVISFSTQSEADLFEENVINAQSEKIKIMLMGLSG